MLFLGTDVAKGREEQLNLGGLAPRQDEADGAGTVAEEGL